ncbi:MAG: class I SAM-dependent methyltransferase [Phycisphaerae bacterium]|nr:class I SAM-dependent methyltransferase [Phycisphaerae bacterium]
MVGHGKMDRCGQAHRRRESVNAAARESLEDWALSIAPAAPGAAVLDLGCGTGKLAIPYAHAVGPTGNVLGVDISPGSIAELQTKAKREGLTNVAARAGNLDEIANESFDKPFDLIVSSYAIYYATDMPGLLRALAAKLTADGRVFVCGPGEGTNREMDELLRRAAPDVEPPEPLADFISLEQIGEASSAYRKLETYRLANAVRFEDAEALLSWWRNHNMYLEAADQAVERALREHFAARGEFTLTKNVLGVLFCR